MADQSTDMKLLSISFQHPVNPGSQQQTHRSLLNSNLSIPSEQHLTEWKYFWVRSGSVTRIKPTHPPLSSEPTWMHESAISCLKWLKRVKTAKLQLHFRQKAWLSSVFPAAVKHVKYKNSQEAGSTKMLLLVYLLGVTAQFRVAVPRQGGTKAFPPYPAPQCIFPALLWIW